MQTVFFFTVCAIVKPHQDTRRSSKHLMDEYNLYWSEVSQSTNASHLLLHVLDEIQPNFDALDYQALLVFNNRITNEGITEVTIYPSTPIIRANGHVILAPESHFELLTLCLHGDSI